MLHVFVSMHIRKVLEQRHMLSDLCWKPAWGLGKGSGLSFQGGLPFTREALEIQNGLAMRDPASRLLAISTKFSPKAHEPHNLKSPEP